MGYTENCNPCTKGEFIEQRVKGWQNEDGTGGVCLAKCLKGNCLWVVWENTLKDGTKKRFIALDLLGCHEGRWGYKDLEESMHPYHYSCPLKYLAMVPKVGCEKWREGVRAYHAERTIPQWAEVGMSVVIKPHHGWASGEIFKLLSKRPFKLERYGEPVGAKVVQIDWPASAVLNEIQEEVTA